MNRLRSAIAVSVITASLVACGSDDAADSSDEATSQDDGGDATSDVSESPFGDDEVGQLREILANFGAPVDETKCVAEEVVGEVSPEELTAFLEAFEANDTEAMDPDVGLAFSTAAETCGFA